MTLSAQKERRKKETKMIEKDIVLLKLKITFKS
jgi:hypothetical protein